MNYVVTLDGKTLCGKPKPTIRELGTVMAYAIAGGDVQRVDPPVDHDFAEGVYVRTIYCSAGTTVITVRHKSQHVTYAVSGRCRVYDESGEYKEVEGPAKWVTEAGTQRAVHCDTDVVWFTAHANPLDIRDVDEIEAYLFEDNLSDVKASVLGDMKMIWRQA
jgi:uncharacterized cupin superfamily protein